MAKFSGVDALHDYMLAGNRVSLLEALLVFGVQGPNQAIFQLKKKGFIVKSGRVSMAAVLRRINQTTLCQAPENLPIREISMMEYWVSF
jgi:hypothetical protein